MAIRPKSSADPLIPTVTVGNTVESKEGSWSRNASNEVSIKELQKKYGWGESSWQSNLLKAADAAGPTSGPTSEPTSERRGNGSVSAAEVNGYLNQPGNARFMSSTAVQQQRTALEQKLTGGTRSVEVDSFDSDWQDEVARRADLISGDANGRLSRAELDTYFRDMKAGKVEDARWVPDQQGAILESKVAESAGELDPLRPAGPQSGLSLVKEYMRLSMDQAQNVPNFVSYLLSAADIQETPAEVDRDNSHFTRDPELGEDGPSEADYTGTGFDRGHMKPAEDSPTQEAMDESHLMSNIAPQHPNLNRQTWRTLEDAVNDLVRSSGGKAHIVTGNLYLDAQGKPLPPEKVDKMGADERRIAVPTHQFKTVLLELPNGHLSMFAYLVPNVKDAPTKKEDITPFLEKARTSVDRIEELLGQDLYAQLPEPVQAQLEKDTSARVAFREASRYEAATLLWPQNS
jgi:endonuclease G